MKHRFQRAKAVGRTKYQSGGIIDQLGGADSIISTASNVANQLAIGNLETETTPTTVPTRRRNYRSFAGSSSRAADRAYREGMLQLGNNALDSEMGKSNLLASKLQTASDVQVQDAQQREQFESNQDVRQDRGRMFNAQMIDRTKGLNLDRYNRKIGAKVSANRAYSQEMLDINAKGQQLDYDTQALLVKAYESEDTGTLTRMAKSFNYPETEEGVNQFIQDFMGRKLKRQ